MEFINIFKVRRTRFEIEKGYQPHSSLFYLLDGAFQIKLNNDWYTVNKGDAIYLPNTLYFERSIIEPLEFIYIRFSDDEVFRDYAGVWKIPNRSYFEETLQFLWPAKNVHNPDAQNLKNHFLTSLFYMCNEKSSSTVCNDRNLLNCIDYMQAHLSQTIHLSDLCSVSNYSRTTLIQKFTQYYKKTPMQHLNNMRINYAKTLLMSTDLAISSIAEQCGFQCPYYFSNIFKKLCGESPSHYRKRHLI